MADRGYRDHQTLADSLGLNLDIKVPPAPPMLPPRKPSGKPRRGKRVFTPLRPLYKVENAFARLGTWRRLSRCYEQTALGAQTWMEVACVAYLCGRLRVEPTGGFAPSITPAASVVGPDLAQPRPQDHLNFGQPVGPEVADAGVLDLDSEPREADRPAEAQIVERGRGPAARCDDAE